MSSNSWRADRQRSCNLRTVLSRSWPRLAKAGTSKRPINSLILVSTSAFMVGSDSSVSSTRETLLVTSRVPAARGAWRFC